MFNNFILLVVYLPSVAYSNSNLPESFSIIRSGDAATMILQLQSLALLAAVLVTPAVQLCNAEAIFSSDTPVASLIASAKAARAQGQNVDAITYFDAAISRNPSDYLTLFQRGATHLALGRNAQAKADFDSALKIRPDFEGALLQRGKIHARNAEWEAAKADYKKVGAKATQELADVEEAEGATYLAFEAEKNGDWEACVNNAGVAVLTAGTALSLRQLRARCRFQRGEIQEGVSDLAHVLQISPGLLEPHVQISSMLFYSLGDTERGLAQVKKCLQSDPDYKPCKTLFREAKAALKSVDKVQKMMESKQYSSAAKVLVGSGTEEDAGLISELKGKTEYAVEQGYIVRNAPMGLYVSHVEKACECYYSMNSLKKAQPHCDLAIQLNPDSLYGLLYKAQKQLDEESFEAAISTLNSAKEHHGDNQTIQQKLQEAETLLKRSKTKDYYKILGVSRDADEATIKRAYRKATKIYHPDKAMGKGVTKEEAEKKMAGINEAYEVLSDPDLKARFDSGEDPNDPMARQGGNPFQQGGNPFGGFGGQPIFFQQAPMGGKRTFKFGGDGGGGGFGGFPFGG